MTDKGLEKILLAAGSRSTGPLQASMFASFEDVPQELERAIADAVVHDERSKLPSLISKILPAGSVKSDD